MSDRKPLAKPEQVSDHLGVSQRTLEYWRRNGKGPRFHRFGHAVRYDWDDVDEWLEDQASAPASGGAA